MGVLRDTAHLAKMIGMDDFARPKAPIALCVDQNAFLYFGGLYPNRDGAQIVQRDMNGLYAALVQSGQDVDIVCADDLRAGRASDYKAVVMAMPAITDAALAGQLSAYVKGGGCLIAETPFAQWDPWGRPVDRAALGLDSLFGLSLETASANVVGGPKFDWSSPPLEKLKGALPMPGALMNASVHSFGSGKAVLYDGALGVTDSEGENVSLSKSLSQILNAFALRSPRPISVEGPGFIDSSYLQDDKGNTLVVLTNPSDKKEAIAKKREVSVSLQPEVLSPHSQVFRLGVFSKSDGTMEAGAVEMTGPIDVTEMDASAIFLIAEDHLPLLTIDAPRTAQVGKSYTVQVKVWNPSPKPVDIFASLKAPAGWKIDRKPLHVLARQSAVARFQITPNQASARSVVVPTIQWANGKELEGVPVDVEVQG